MSDPRGPASGSGLPPHLDPRGVRPSSGAPRVARLPHGSRPVPPPPTRGRRVARVLSWVAATLSIAVFAVAALGYVLYSRYDGQISRIPGLTAALPGLVKPPAAPRDARNVLLVGSDSRAGVGASYGADSGQRSDTIILAHLFGDSDAAQLVSFPRDSWVTIPEYTDPATGVLHPAHPAKINSAIDEGGPQLLIATVEQLTQIRVDNYVQVDFAGFQTMVDQLGGVEVCLLHAVKEPKSQIDLPAGRQVVRGQQALAFVRQRHGLPGGDLDRIHRQQAFLGSIARKALSSGTLLNPGRLNGFLDAVTRSVSVDDSLKGSELTALALRLRSFTAGGVSFTTVPVSDPGAVRERQSVVLLDPAKDEQLFESLRRDLPPGKKPRGRAPARDPLTVAPADVWVQVLNGSGVAGLGRRAAADLRGAGFDVVGVPGNRGTGATTSVVRYGPAQAEAARTLVAALPGSTLEPAPELGRTLELVLGSDYSGASTVRAGSDATAAPSPAAPTPAAAKPALTAAQDGCIA